MQMKRIITIIMISALSLAAVSCGKRANIEGEWKITSVCGQELPDTKAAPTVNFNLETGRIHCYTGVNIVNGEYEYEGRRLTLNGMGMTMMAGPEEDMAVERLILDTLEKVRSVRHDDTGGLEFMNENGEVIMTLARR